MGGNGQHQLSDWMAAERRGREDEADAAFAAVFAGRVPKLQPAPGFGDRVVLRLAAQAAVTRRRAVPVWVRAALAAALGGVGAAGALFWSAGIFSLFAALREAVPTAGTLVGAAHSWLAAAVHASNVLVSVARAISLAVSSGPAAAIVVANLVLACSASCALKRLLAPQEE